MGATGGAFGVASAPIAELDMGGLLSRFSSCLDGVDCLDKNVGQRQLSPQIRCYTQFVS